MSGNWQLTSNGWLSWGEEPGEDASFMLGMLIARLEQKLKDTRHDPALLQQMPLEAVPITAKPKIEKLAHWLFLRVSFQDINAHWCYPTFRLLYKFKIEELRKNEKR